MSVPVKTENPMLTSAAAEAPRYIKKSVWPVPLCCITGDSWHTSVTSEETSLRYSVTVCELPVKRGAGYRVVQLPHSHATSFGISSVTLCCCCTSGTGFVAVRPTNYTQRTPLTSAENLQDFLGRLWRYVPLAQGQAVEVPWGAPPAHGEAKKVVQCGCKSRSLKLHANGQVLLEDVERGALLSSRRVQAASLQDFTYMQYHRAPCLQALCCGKENKVQVSFLGDKYTMEAPGSSAAELDAFHLGLQAAQLGRPPGPPLRVIAATAGSKVTIGPEFTTVEVASCAWAGPLCKTTEVATVRTADINYFAASLPSWLNALMATLRDFQLYKCTKEASRCMTADLLQLPVWPVAFAYRSWIVAGLLAKFLCSFVTFLVVFFCRATSLTLGGPQGARPVTLPIAEENPEAMLKEISVAVARAQKMHQWGPAGTPAAQQQQQQQFLAAQESTGASKGPAATAAAEVSPMTLPSTQAGPPVSAAVPHFSTEVSLDPPPPPPLPSGQQPGASGLAATMAAQMWKEGHGELPPQWDHEQTEEGEVYFVKPSGEVTWEDPRSTLEEYTQEFAAAERRGVNLAKYFH